MSTKYSKQHYKDMARILREVREEHTAALAGGLASPSVILGSVEERMAALFAEDNPRFDSARFLKAARSEPQVHHAE